MTNWKRATVLALAAATFVALAAPASAGTTKVSGAGVYVFDSTVCAPGGDYPPLGLTGNLEGCWYTFVSSAKGNPSGTYQETGTELFVGCLNTTTCGTFSTTYTFTGKFTPSLAEIHGRCQHSITGGTGGFAGLSGVVNFKDDVDAGIFYYRGDLRR
jgi:hypothetical protein